LYSVDIRRMKGQLWAFGWVYGKVLEELGKLEGRKPIETEVD